MAKKKYSIRERAMYHEKRANSLSASEGKKLYSQQWLEGYHDKNAEFNYPGICHEIDYRKKDKGSSKNFRVMLEGYKNGLKAQLDSKK